MSRTPILEHLAHPFFFESIDNLDVDESDFIDPVKKLLQGEWALTRKSVWCNCSPPEGRARDLPMQGWKIHVSSSVTNALEILTAIVPILDAKDISFKFALDERVLGMMNGKTWDRQGAGKFVTIYPVDRTEFIHLLEDLDAVTRNFQGIYILSDRRYKNSKVLFYRYGGIRPLSLPNEKGEEVSMLISPTGDQVPDERKPYFHVPPWERDPFEGDGQGGAGDAEARDAEGRIALKDGRYLVTSALGFNNSGGIYLADDIGTGETVIVKEARPFVTFGGDAVALLAKEHRLLSKIAEAGETFAPKPIDLFQDWEHHFLVQEYIPGTQLGAYSAAKNVTLLTHPTLEDTTKYFQEFRQIFCQLARILQKLHDLNIIYTDLSPSNVLILTEPLQVRLIDFEASHEVDVDEPARVFTLGFAYRDQMYGGVSHFESDYFALGALMLNFLAPFNQIFGIAPRLRFTFLKAVIDDIGFPSAVYELILTLIDNAVEERPNPERVIEVLEQDYPLRPPSFSVDDESACATYQKYVDGVCTYCLALADYDRKDRLFPAYGKIFHTNPLSLSYGACGVAHAIQAMEHEVPDSVTDWILQPTSERDSYPPGMYMGLSGLAWTVLDLGHRATAERILSLSYAHPLRYRSFDLFHGAAGWGLVNLRFFLRLEDELYLGKAIEAGEFLLKASQESDKGIFWQSDDQIPLGLAHGPSGVSLFLLYLYLATGREDLLASGIRALDYDLSRGVPTRDGGLSWRRYDDEGSILYPYLRYGSAGVGMVLVRYYFLLGDERYRSYIERIFLDLNRKYAVFPGLFIGLAGLGEALLDFHLFTGEARFRKAAQRVATGLSLFRIEKEEGIAFPGDGLTKICCDLATGSAGIGRFFHRLIHGSSAPLVVDELLTERSSPPVLSTPGLDHAHAVTDDAELQP